MHPPQLLRHPTSFPRWTSKTERTWRSFLYQMERLDFEVSFNPVYLAGLPCSYREVHIAKPGEEGAALWLMVCEGFIEVYHPGILVPGPWEKPPYLVPMGAVERVAVRFCSKNMQAARWKAILKVAPMRMDASLRHLRSLNEKKQNEVLGKPRIAAQATLLQSWSETKKAKGMAIWGENRPDVAARGPLEVYVNLNGKLSLDQLERLHTFWEALTSEPCYQVNKDPLAFTFGEVCQLGDLDQETQEVIRAMDVGFSYTLYPGVAITRVGLVSCWTSPG